MNGVAHHQDHDPAQDDHQDQKDYCDQVQFHVRQLVHPGVRQHQRAHDQVPNDLEMCDRPNQQDLDQVAKRECDPCEHLLTAPCYEAPID